MQIPAFKYYFPEIINKWISERISNLLNSNEYLTMGKYCEQFEQEFKKISNTKFAVSVSSGIAALEIALKANNICDGEIILPTNTFGATALAVINSGATPIFCDINYDMNISISDVKKNISSKTKAIIPVHIGGMISEDMLDLKEYCVNNSIFLLEDAAHAHGSKLNNINAGSFGDAAGFSFFATKVLTTGEGGMITTSDKNIYESAKLLRNYNKIKGSEIREHGYNWRMSEIQAIIGIGQMSIVDEVLQMRQKVAKIYDELLKNNKTFSNIEKNEDSKSSYYKYIRYIPFTKNTEELQEILKRKYNVELAGYVYDIPLHKQNYLGRYMKKGQLFPNADIVCHHHICLPIYPQMSDKEIHYVVDSLRLAVNDLGWE